VGLLLLLLAGSGIVLVRGERHRLVREGFSKITNGMSRADVEQILGPPRYVASRSWATFYLYRGAVSDTHFSQVECWGVRFTPAGKVDNVWIGEEPRWPLLEKIRARLP
jgi:hypothetical protein